MNVPIFTRVMQRPRFRRSVYSDQRTRLAVIVAGGSVTLPKKSKDLAALLKAFDVLKSVTETAAVASSAQ